MEIHRAPGPPRTHVVVVDETRVAVLEVQPDRDVGAIHHADRRRWQVERPPAASEWWVSDPDGRPVATIVRTGLIGERFEVQLDELTAIVTPRGGWRRRWRVTDAEDRDLLSLTQRPLRRPIHDLVRRSGDVPEPLPWLVAWCLALATTAPPAATRRPRWTSR